MKSRVLVGLVILCAASAAHLAAGKKYSYVRVGSTSDVATQTAGGTVLMGGGSDVDVAFQWMCGRAGNGDFLVIRATGTDAYNPYIQGLCPQANSVATLVVPTTAAANDAFVINAIRTAEAVWIAGGDQSDYIGQWAGTGLQNELNSAIARGVPVGGTSAGMMVLTQFVYSAMASQGVTSSQALADPFNKYISLARDFALVGILQNTLGDSHFVTRDRMGRDLAFMCRVAANGWSSAPRDVALDEATALLIDSNTASVVGSGSAYFLKAPGPAEVCQPRTPVTYTNVGVLKVASGGSFDLGRWSTTSGTAYTVSANAGVLTSTQADGAIY